MRTTFSGFFRIERVYYWVKNKLILSKLFFMRFKGSILSLYFISQSLWLPRYKIFTFLKYFHKVNMKSSKLPLLILRADVYLVRINFKVYIRISIKKSLRFLWLSKSLPNWKITIIKTKRMETKRKNSLIMGWIRVKAISLNLSNQLRSKIFKVNSQCLK